MIKLLIVTYDFPPIGGVSVQRVLSLVKHLPEHGISVSVLTARNSSSPVFDTSLSEQIPPSVRVYRVWTPELSHRMKTTLWSLLSPDGTAGSQKADEGQQKGIKARITDLVKGVFSPDPNVVWVPFALRRARKIVRRERIDAVLVTAPPFSAFLIGNALRREFPGLRLVSDFRDEWLRYLLKDFAFFQGGIALKKAAVIEKETVGLSDLVVAVTSSSIAQLRGRYPDQPAAKFAVVPNGYDPAAFDRFQSRPHRGNKLRITYLGTIYSVCSPRYYLDALDELPAEVRDDFETVLIGRVVDDERKYLESRKSRLQLMGFLAQRDAFRQLEEADYALLTVVNDFCIAGKLFEYLRAGKPILAITPPGGETGKLIAETRGGWCVDPQDRAGIRDLLLRVHAEWQSGSRSYAPNHDRIREYERPRLAGKIAELIQGRVRDIEAERQNV